MERFFVALYIANDFLEDTWYQGKNTNRFLDIFFILIVFQKFLEMYFCQNKMPCEKSEKKEVILNQHFQDIWQPDDLTRAQMNSALGLRNFMAN